VYAELFRTGSLWLQASFRRGDSLFYAHQLRHIWGYISTAYRDFASERSRGVFRELATFTRAYARKRLSRTVGASNA